MRKKQIEKLKSEIKKDVIKEMNKNKELENNVIKQPEFSPVLNHTKEELHSIQKSFFMIFAFAVVVLFVIVVIIIVNPFSDNKDSGGPSKDKEVVEEYDPNSATLLELKEGTIPNTNKYVLELFNSLKFEQREYYNYDSTYLFSKDELNINEIDNKYLLFLMSKTEAFNNYMQDTNLLTKVEICNKDGNIKIPLEEINTIINNNFNATLTNTDDFIYTYYIEDQYSAYIRFVYSDGYYVSFCTSIEEKLKYNSIAVPMIKEASKGDGQIKINVKTAFVTSEKVYSNYELTNILSNDISSDILSYISNADEYQYIFKLENNNYKLEKIVKIN